MGPQLVKIVKPCIDQDSKRRMTPGDVVELSDFERGRHLAEGNAVPYVKEERETAIAEVIEVRAIETPRRRGRPKK